MVGRISALVGLVIGVVTLVKWLWNYIEQQHTITTNIEKLQRHQERNHKSLSESVDYLQKQRDAEIKALSVELELIRERLSTLRLRQSTAFSRLGFDDIAHMSTDFEEGF